MLNYRDWPLYSNPDDESYPVVLSENGPCFALTDSLDSNFIASFIIFAFIRLAWLSVHSNWWVIGYKSLPSLISFWISYFNFSMISSYGGSSSNYKVSTLFNISRKDFGASLKTSFVYFISNLSLKKSLNSKFASLNFLWKSLHGK